MLLKINHFVFRWYYNRVDAHFKQWTFFKSVKLLIDNYRHCLFRESQNEKLISEAIKREDKLTSELNRIKMSLVASDHQIDSINEFFGTNFNKTSEN